MTTPSRECKCSEEAMCLQGSKSHLVRAVNIGDVPQIFGFFCLGQYIKSGEGGGEVFIDAPCLMWLL